MPQPAGGSRPSSHALPAWHVPAGQERREGLLPARTAIRRPFVPAQYGQQGLEPEHAGHELPFAPGELVWRYQKTHRASWAPISRTVRFGLPGRLLLLFLTTAKFRR